MGKQGTEVIDQEFVQDTLDDIMASMEENRRERKELTRYIGQLDVRYIELVERRIRYLRLVEGSVVS